MNYQIGQKIKFRNPQYFPDGTDGYIGEINARQDLIFIWTNTHCLRGDHMSGNISPSTKGYKYSWCISPSWARENCETIKPSFKNIEKLI